MNLKPTLPHRLAHRTIIAALLGAVATPVSLANAQFRVEYSDSETRTASSEPDAAAKGNRTFVFKSEDGEHSYEVKIVNGTVEFAQVDGQRIAADRVITEAERVIILGDDNKKIYEFKVPAMTRSVWTPRGDDEQAFVIGARVERPTVMLGINLTEPGEAMRKQLKLGKDQQVILVEKVIDGLPAQRAGLEDYDVILSIDGSDHASSDLLGEVMRKKQPGDAIKLVVLRAGEKKQIVAKLDAYNPDRLGVSLPDAPEGSHRAAPTPPNAPKAPQVSGTRGFPFAEKLSPEVHERIMKALKASGLDKEELARVHEQIEAQLESLNGLFTVDGFHEDGDGGIELRFELSEHLDDQHRRAMDEAKAAVEAARDKARIAMREAERQVMELHNGRLVVRNAERMDDGLSKLESRLDALESRLEAQMDRVESQMDRIMDMFERMMDRLEADER